MGTSFGEQLRAERWDRRLTQEQLGNDILGPREISLLETGRREPAPEIIRLLSGRLASMPGRSRKAGPERGSSGTGSSGTGSSGAAGKPPDSLESSALFLGLCARQSFDERDYGGAHRQAAAAAEASLSGGDTSFWWSMTYLAASCRQATHAYRDCILEAEVLVSHPQTAEHPALRVQVETLLANAFQGAGELDKAVRHAGAAVRAAQEHSLAAPAFLAACAALVEPLAEAGRLDEAWEYCRTLMLPLLEGGMDTQTRGRAFWAVGRVAFRRGDTRAGLMHHRTAATLLQPGADVELWARFNSDTAALRLAAGIHDRETLACIEHAEAARSVVGLQPSDQLELMHSRGLWQDLNGNHALAVGMLSAVYARRQELPPQTSGEVALHLGLALAHTGRAEAGSACLADSERCFRRVGARDRAAHAAALAHRIRPFSPRPETAPMERSPWQSC